MHKLLTTVIASIRGTSCGLVQFEKPAQRHPVRTTVAEALIALANAVTPTTRREVGAA